MQMRAYNYVGAFVGLYLCTFEHMILSYNSLPGLVFSSSSSSALTVPNRSFAVKLAEHYWNQAKLLSPVEPYSLYSAFPTCIYRVAFLLPRQCHGLAQQKPDDDSTTAGTEELPQPKATIYRDRILEVEARSRTLSDTSRVGLINRLECPIFVQQWCL